MGRDQWLAPFAWNFEPEKRWPLDARFVVEYQSDLTQPATWTAYDWNEWTYKGMLVSVWNDNTNNWIYILTADDYTQLTNWVSVWDTGTTVLEDNRVSKYQITTPFQANEVIDLTNWTGSIAWICNHFWDLIDWTDKDIWAGAGVFFAENGLNVYLKWTGELYKSDTVVWDSPTSCHFTVPLQIGDYFWIEKDAWMGMWGSTWADALEWTYAELKALKDTNSLVPWNWYKLTDYQTVNDAWYNVINTGNIEPLYLQAFSTNSFMVSAFSDIYPDDILEYDFDLNTIVKEFDWEYEDWVDLWEDITISNVTQHSFEVNREIVMDSSFELEVEDDNDWYSYDDWDLWTKYTITDIWWGQYRIDLIDTANDPIDLTDPNHNYIYIHYNSKLADRKWYITLRELRSQNIKTYFDFRWCMWARRKKDVSWIPNFVLSNTYNYNDLVRDWDKIYQCAYTTTNHPVSWNYFVAVINRDCDHCYNTSTWNVSVPEINWSEKLFYTFWKWDATTETHTFSLDWLKNIELLSEDVVTANLSNQEIHDLKVDSGCSKIHLWGRINGLYIPYNSSKITHLYWDIINTATNINGTLTNVVMRSITSLTILWNIWNAYLNGSWNTIGYSGNGLIINSSTLTLWHQARNIRILWWSWNYIGNQARDSYRGYGFLNVVGDAMRNIYIEDNDFNNNTIWSQRVNFHLHPWAWLNYCILWNVVGSSSHTMEITGRRWKVRTGSYCFFSGETMSNGFRRDDVFFWDYVRNIAVQYISWCNIGTTTRNLTFHALYKTNIGHSCRDISMPNIALQNCDIKTNNYNHTNTDSTNTISNLEIASDIGNIDFSWWSIIYQTYTKKIMKRQDNTNRLQYLDNSDTMQYVAPNA